MQPLWVPPTPTVRLSASPTPAPPFVGHSQSTLPHRSTIRVQNEHDGTMYHLVFDGNLLKLSMLALKQHLCPILGCSAAQLALSYHGVPLGDADMGLNIGLTDGAQLGVRIRGLSITKGPERTPQATLPSQVTRQNWRPILTPCEFDYDTHEVQVFQSPNKHIQTPYVKRSFPAISEDNDVHCIEIEEDDNHPMPASYHSNCTLQETTDLFNADLAWAIEHKKFETERKLKNAQLQRDEMILQQKSTMLELEFEEMQLAMMYENMKAEVVQRDIRRSYELDTICRGTKHPFQFDMAC